MLTKEIQAIKNKATIKHKNCQLLRSGLIIKQGAKDHPLLASTTIATGSFLLGYAAARAPKKYLFKSFFWLQKAV